MDVTDESKEGGEFDDVIVEQGIGAEAGYCQEREVIIICHFENSK